MKKELEKILRKAFTILRRNYGCPGNDGISIQIIKSDFNNHLNYIIDQVENNKFKFEESPKKTTITDYLGKPRTIVVYNVYERWVQEYIRMVSQDSINAFLSNHVYGYRRNKKDVEAYNYILESSPQFVLRLDIFKFFDSINQKILFLMMEETELGLEIVNLMKQSFASYPSGLPQGHVMSPLLSNFYLYKFDSNFLEGYTRYADDMIFRIEKPENVASLIKKVTKLLEIINLKLNIKKTIIIKHPTLENLK